MLEINFVLDVKNSVYVVKTGLVCKFQLFDIVELMVLFGHIVRYRFQLEIRDFQTR